MKETFGQRFYRLRKARGLTQEDIAKKLNISSQAISKWENDVSLPDISLLADIADMFNISTDELLGKEINGTKKYTQAGLKQANIVLASSCLFNPDTETVVNVFPFSNFLLNKIKLKLIKKFLFFYILPCYLTALVSKKLQSWIL